MNKRGIGSVLMIFFLVLGLAFIALIGTIGVAVTNDFFDEIVPVANDLGVVTGNGLPGDNLSQNANYVVTPGNTIANSLGWIMGIGYIFCLVMIIALSVSFRVTGEKWLILFFFLLLLLALGLSILISNTYQDLYETNDSFGAELRAQTLSSWLLLYSPLITLIVMLFAALIMFTGVGAGNEVYA